MYSDPIADFLIRIKNAQSRRHAFVQAPYSALKLALAKILEQAGYVKSVEVGDEQKPHQHIKVELKYDELGDPAISNIRRKSKPSQRIYAKKNEIKSQQYSLIIISTSRGLMTDREAKKAGLGGEIICQIW